MAIDPKTGKYIPEGLSSLRPEYQAQYYALEPEIERTVREATNARGTYYSGDAIAEEARAKESLLASLANASAGQSATASENQKDREARAEQSAQSNKAAIMGPALGAGLGAIGTLGGLYATGALGKKYVPIVLNNADGSQTIKMIDPSNPASLASPAAGQAQASGGFSGAFKTGNLGKTLGYSGLGIGAGTGLAQLAGGKNLTGSLGLGVGGSLAGGLLGSGNPWGFGLGGLAGAFGGGYI